MAWLPNSFDLLNKTTGFAGLRVIRDIPFGRHIRQKLDIHAATPRAAPAFSASQEPLPVILFFYGGSWQRGERRDYRFVAAALARLGFMVVIPDYRLYPQVRFPAFLHDCAAAVAWVFKNIASHGGDTQSVYLMGHSAGAYNAAMLALDPGYLNAAGLAPERLAGWIGLAGPYDFLPFHDRLIAEIFGTTPDENLTQPIHFIAEGSRKPPALLLHGGRDRVVRPGNTAALAARLRQTGNAVETRIYPRLGHAGILVGCVPWLQWRAALLHDLTQFSAACRNGEFAGCGSDISAPMLR